MIAGPSAGTNSAPVTLKRYQTLETGVRTPRASSYTNEVPRVRESACASSLVIPMREDSADGGHPRAVCRAHRRADAPRTGRGARVRRARTAVARRHRRRAGEAAEGQDGARD